ncbi:hypothetical protein HMPREF1979_03276 [Actinomyces johnsonii F0542]|uniref:Uncharacterized protein n=1 Tax=Actinomyces johnsonii F0542 TaxID=1321818 RepID=U1QF13_9ACTO|nr:hypothetical protein HMPREF1979_03276 [Actinomyces johnsonii F0542]
MGGSSPLARGLRSFNVVTILSGRIIPARAGFTDVDAGRGGALPDHPRSRGVYLKQLGGRRSAAGSSPLARGLRSFNVVTILSGRIIPARAGFTHGWTEN